MLTAFLVATTLRIIHACHITSRQLVLFFSMAALFVAASFALQGGGLLLYGEADWFLIDHNDPDRSLWSKIICPHRHDAEQYLAREVTHIVEHIDARFIHFCTMNGIPHFLSISTYAFLVAIAFMVWVACRKEGLALALSILLSCVFLTAPPILLAGSYVRPGHAHASFWATVLMMWLVYGQPQKRWQRVVATYAISLVMVWSDRQGLFFAAMVVLTILFLFRDRITEAACIFAAAITHTAYYLAIGPALVFAVSGVKIGESYQMGVVSGLLGIIFQNAAPGLRVTLANLSGLLGNIPSGAAAVVAIAASVAFKLNRLAVIAWFLLIALMYALIMHHQTALAWPDMIFTAYYNIFGTTLMFLVGAFLILRFKDHHKALVWVLAILVAGNVSVIFRHVEAIKRGHLTGFIAGAPHLKEALRQAVNQPDGTNTVKLNTRELFHFTEFKYVIKNPLEYGGRLTAQEFAESSWYLQFVRSQKKLPFGRGGRE